MAGDNQHNTWSDLGTRALNATEEALHNKWVDGALAVGVATAVVASRGKLAGLAEKYLPRISGFAGDEAASGMNLAEHAESPFGLIPPVPRGGALVSRSDAIAQSALQPTLSHHLLGHDQIYPLLAKLDLGGAGSFEGGQALEKAMTAAGKTSLEPKNWLENLVRQDGGTYAGDLAGTASATPSRLDSLLRKLRVQE